MLDNTEGVIKRDNPEKLATLGTQNTGQINVREYPRGNEKKEPLRYSLTFICPVSCIPYVASFSGLSFVLLPLRYSLTCICPVSCLPYVASFSGLSFFITNTEEVIKKRQSRETANIGYTRHRTNKC
jgi:hypothetical protein